VAGIMFRTSIIVFFISAIFVPSLIYLVVFGINKIRKAESGDDRYYAPWKFALGGLIIVLLYNHSPIRELVDNKHRIRMDDIRQQDFRLSSR